MLRMFKTQNVLQKSIPTMINASKISAYLAMTNLSKYKFSIASNRTMLCKINI